MHQPSKNIYLQNSQHNLSTSCGLQFATGYTFNNRRSDDFLQFDKVCHFYEEQFVIFNYDNLQNLYSRLAIQLMKLPVICKFRLLNH
ncbi:MAG: hypothetical protein ACJAWT_001274 [Glaciecola sp.]|jgi:hypothetical protein